MCSVVVSWCRLQFPLHELHELCWTHITLQRQSSYSMKELQDEGFQVWESSILEMSMAENGGAAATWRGRAAIDASHQGRLVQQWCLITEIIRWTSIQGPPFMGVYRRRRIHAGAILHQLSSSKSSDRRMRGSRARTEEQNAARRAWASGARIAGPDTSSGTRSRTGALVLQPGPRCSPRQRNCHLLIPW